MNILLLHRISPFSQSISLVNDTMRHLILLIISKMVFPNRLSTFFLLFVGKVIHGKLCSGDSGVGVMNHVVDFMVNFRPPLTHANIAPSKITFFATCSENIFVFRGCLIKKNGQTQNNGSIHTIQHDETSPTITNLKSLELVREKATKAFGPSQKAKCPLKKEGGREECLKSNKLCVRGFETNGNKN